jgi:hypothetical protein
MPLKISKRDNNLLKDILTRNPNQLLLQLMKKYFFGILAHADRGKHSKFQKLWLGPYKIASVIGNNSYLLKDLDGQLFSYTTNGSHLKHYVEPD